MGIPQPSATDLEPGQLFAGRYEIGALIGRGGMGAVYRALDRSLGEEIALKLLLLGDDASPNAVERFRQEVRLARKVTHPNVARVYDLGEHDGVLYLTMELVDGGTLRGVLRAEPRLDPLRAARIGRALGEGLRAAHAAGVIHRDLKPPNVLIDRRGRVVISDFGIARSLVGDAHLTQGAVGTPMYMAPEQASSGPVDARTDLYALGLILYEMLAGERPQGTLPALASALAEAEVPTALAEIVLRCLAREPEGRPRSADEVARALAAAIPEAALDDAGGVTIAAPAAPAGDPITRPAVLKARTAATGASLRGRSLELRADRAIAVLPFRYLGPKDQDYLGDAITDELVDVLSRTRGLYVLGSGATAKYRGARDPLAIGRELDVFAIIDGTVQLGGSRVRITARLIDASTGVQLWSDHHEGGIEDIFALQESIGRKVAEELRVEITTLTHRGDAPPEAIELYLSSRRRLRALDYSGVITAVQGLERCIELAPGFGPALAAHAVGCLRAWFLDFGAVMAIDWEKASRESVTRALERAPELAETHLAGGIHATQYGDYASAARALARSLAIAPTCAEAHEYLGILQCEGGQSEEGVKRLTLASELDPSLTYCMVFIARHHALHGRFDACDATLEELEHRRGTGQIAASSLRVRSAAWRGDRDALRQRLAEARQPDAPAWRVVYLYGAALLGEIDEDAAARGFAAVLGAAQNPRFQTLATQLVTEVQAGLGNLAAARTHLFQAASSVLVDVEWLDHCPLLEALRDVDGFAEARRKVMARANGIWSL